MSTPMVGRTPTTEREARLAWARIAEPGDRRVHALGAHDDPLAALAVVVDGTDPDHDRFRVRLRDLDVDRDLEIVGRLGARLLVPGDDEWPTALADLPDPPLALWVRGPLPLAAVPTRSVALVGSRASTAYGNHVAGELAAGLADRRFVVVSGAAYGIDARAHDGALASGGAPTAAVLAGGVDRPYPAGNARLIAEIATTGLLVSETPPGCAPTKSRFLSRNRLIAALTCGTVVVEAGWRSGALSTARHAARILRPVGAVPGPVTSAASAGTNEAIRSGLACCVTDAAEVAELCGRLGDDLAPEHEQPTLPTDGLDDEEQRVLAALPVRRAVDVDRLCTTAGLSGREVSRALGRLALLALAVRDDEGRWRLAPRG